MWRSLAAVVVCTAIVAEGVMGASAVVASKDSRGKARADYVCDGVDDHLQVQQAVDSLAPTGGMVQLLEGTFHFGGDVVITTNNVTIKGMGRSTILKHDPTEWIVLTKDEAKGAKTITVKDAGQFRVGQLIGVTDHVTDPRSRNRAYYYYRSYYIPSPYYAVRSIAGHTLTLDRGLHADMTVAKNARAAPGWVMIRAYAKRNIELSDFAIDGNRDHVARIFAGYNYYVPPPGYPNKPSPPPATIFEKVHHGEEPTSAIYMDYTHETRFTNLFIHDVAMSGIFLFACDYVLVQGNTIRDFGLKGYVDCFGSYTRIIGNIVENSLHEDGITIYDVPSGFTTVSNNIVRNCARACILINQGRRVTVTGNNVYGTGESGVGIGVCTKEATVTGNYVENAGVAFQVMTLDKFWGDSAKGYPITLTGNSVRDCYTGFSLRNGDHVTLVGNVVAGIKGRGAVVSTGGRSANRCIISHNQFLNGSSGTHSAIRLGGDNHLLFGNKIKNFKKGIVLEPGAEGNVIERNEFIDVPQHVIDKGTRNTQRGNG